MCRKRGFPHEKESRACATLRLMVASALTVTAAVPPVHRAKGQRDEDWTRLDKTIPMATGTIPPDQVAVDDQSTVPVTAAVVWPCTTAARASTQRILQVTWSCA